jgi:HEAT repeat protein
MLRLRSVNRVVAAILSLLALTGIGPVKRCAALQALQQSKAGSHAENEKRRLETTRMEAPGRKARDTLIELLRNRAPAGELKQALEAVTAAGDDPDKVVEAIKDIPGEASTPPDVRSAAAVTLMSLGHRARPAIRALIKEIPIAKSDAERKDVAKALYLIGVTTEHVASLKSLLTVSHDLWEIETAVDVLAQIGTGARTALPEILALLQANVPNAVKASVIDALKAIGIRDGSVVGALFGAFGDQHLRRSAIDAASSLFSLDTNYDDQSYGVFIGYLIRYLDPPDESWDVRRSAVTALGSIDVPDEVRERLLANAPSDKVTQLATDLDNVANLVRAAIQDRQWQVRVAAIEAIGLRIQADAAKRKSHPALAPLVDELVSCLADASWDVRRAAAKSLGDLPGLGESPRKEVARAVVPLLDLIDPNRPGETPPKFVRQAASRSLVQIRPDEAMVDEIRSYKEATKPGRLVDADEIVDILIRSIGDADLVVRGNATETLASIGRWSLSKIESILQGPDRLANLQEPARWTEPKSRELIAAVRVTGMMEVNNKRPSGVERALPLLVDLCRCGRADEAHDAANHDLFKKVRSESRESILKILRGLGELSPPLIPGALIALDDAIGAGGSASRKKRDRSSGFWADPNVCDEINAELKSVRASLIARIEPSRWQRLMGGTAEFISWLGKYYVSVILATLLLLYAGSRLYWLIDPLARINLNEWLSTDLRFNLKLFGFEIPTGDILRLITLTRFGGNSQRSLDAWVTHHSKSATVAFEAWQIDGESAANDAAGAGNPLGDAFGDLDAIAVEFQKERVGVLIVGGDRRQQDRIVQLIALRSLSAKGITPLSTHRMLPVVIASNARMLASGQDGLIESVRGQLRVLLETADPPSRQLVESLLRFRRIVLLITASNEQIDSLREIIESPTFPANAVFIVLRPGAPRAVAVPVDGASTITVSAADESAWSFSNVERLTPRLVRPSRVVIAALGAAHNGARNSTGVSDQIA